MTEEKICLSFLAGLLLDNVNANNISLDESMALVAIRDSYGNVSATTILRMLEDD